MRPRRLQLRLLAVLLLTAFSLVAVEPQDLVNQVVQANYTHYMTNLLFTHDGDSRGPYAPQHELARANIQRIFSSFGLTVTLHPFVWRGGTFYNVEALLPGRVRPNEYHILGAHYDSTNTPGANDDADGIAALLESARVLSQHQFESSILFLAFDLEEAGLIGSYAWVRDHRNERVLSMLQLDGIVFNGNNWGHDGIGVMVADYQPNPTRTAVYDALARYSGGIWPVDWGLSTRSDHYPFANFAPAVQLTEASWDVNYFYHQQIDSLDTPGLADFRYATGITKTAVGYLATQAVLMPENEAELRFSTAGVANAASSVVETIAPSQFIALKGAGFASGESAVRIRDSAGVEHVPTTTYFSARQINLVTPEAVATGAATISVAGPDGARASATVPVEAIAPGVFTANQSGSGAAVAQAVRLAPNGTLTWQELVTCDNAAPRVCTTNPVDFGGDQDRVVLVLYATGVRGRNDLSLVYARIDRERFPAQYAGPQPTFPGLDQVNIELPRTLLGRGEVEMTLWVDGRAANPVIVNLGPPVGAATRP